MGERPDMRKPLALQNHAGTFVRKTLYSDEMICLEEPKRDRA